MKNNHESDAATPATLLNDLHALVAEAEKMIEESQGGGETREELLGSIRARFNSAQECFTGLYATTRQKVVAGAKYADDTIRANPYPSIAIAAGVGLLVGVLAGRTRK
jgi:ElaB/YqjD/DUF883 family membrane-anchored ribosome-binding protein